MNEILTATPPVVGVTPAADGLTRFDRVEPDAHFSLPARPTVKQQLEYYSAYAETRNEPLYLRMWRSAQPLIVEWDCAALPDRTVDLDKVTSSDATSVIMWAGNLILQHMNDLDTLPKV